MNPRSKRKTQKSKSSNKTGHVLLLLSPVHHHFRSAGATSVISPTKGNARRHFCTIPYHSRPLVQKRGGGRPLQCKFGPIFMFLPASAKRRFVVWRPAKA